MKGVVRAAGAVIVLGVLAIAGGVGYGLTLLEPVSPVAEPRTFRVEPGDGLNRVAHRLDAAGLVQSSLATRLLGRARGVQTRIKAGEYDLSAALSTGEILDRLALGNVKTYQVSLPEGIRATEIAARLADAGLVDADAFLRLVQDPAFAGTLGVEADGLEGYLFPETYHFAKGLPAREIVATLVRQFQDVWDDLAESASRSSMTRHEIVTLASIVEKETADPTERPLIAAVFLNRLAKRMRLETDPTVIYGIPNFDGNLKRRDLENRKNPYNTYRIFGLPPGPIASPGRDALRAVLAPADSEYLYFVSRNDGTHKFSVTYREHVNAVNEYQRRRRR